MVEEANTKKGVTMQESSPDFSLLIDDSDVEKLSEYVDVFETLLTFNLEPSQISEAVLMLQTQEAEVTHTYSGHNQIQVCEATDEIFRDTKELQAISSTSAEERGTLESSTAHQTEPKSSTPLLPSHFACNLCKYTRKLDFDAFLKHVYCVHQIKYRCVMCTRGYKDWDSTQIANHWSQKHRSTPIYVMSSRVTPVLPKLPQFPWRCPICTQQFPEETLRALHMNTCYNASSTYPVPQPKFNCEACPNAYFSPEEVKFHLVTQHPALFQKSPFKCDPCQRFFNTGKKLRLHRIRQHYTDLYRCPTCDQGFHGESSLKNHKSTAHSNQNSGENLTCPTCNQSFVDMVAKAMHLSTPCVISQPAHESSRSFSKCPVCEKLLYISSMKRHLEIHDQRRHHKCNICGETMAKAHALQWHMAQFHGILEDVLKCLACDKTFATELKRMEHKCERKLCHVCGLICEDKREFGRHFYSAHVLRVTNTCKICDRKVATVETMKRHLARVHSIGRFKCEENGCRMVFWRKQLLENHASYVHQKEVRLKNHFCEVCQKGFATPGIRNKHWTAVHVNKDTKPYACEHCKKRFAVKSYLWTHMKVHGEKIRKRSVE